MKKIISTLSIFLIMLCVSFGKNTNHFNLDTVPQTITDTAFLRVLGKAVGGDAPSMFIIGKCYLLGSHVKRDLDKAFEWNNRAIIAGYIPAHVEKGLYYKYGTGRPIDYTLAYQSFCNAANANSTNGLYHKGYMLYKGFGCQQNYAAAVQEFKKGRNLNSPACMYMLGICFRNGFGITTNIDSARFWLRKSAELDYDLAEDELTAKHPVYCPQCTETAQNRENAFSIAHLVGLSMDQYSTVQNNATIQDLNGLFTGYILKYDWSKTKIIEAVPLVTLMTAKDSIVKWVWGEGAFKNVLHLSSTLKNNHFVFDKRNYRRKDHFHPAKPLLNTFKSANLEVIYSYNKDTILMGNLELFVSSLKEPQNSLMLVLIKNTTANGQGKAEAIKKIVTSAVQIEQLQKQVILVNPPNEVITKPIISLLQAFPNPFDGQIDVEFNLSQASDVKIKIISAIGIELYENSIKNLPSGENSVLLEPDNIPSGFYLISLEAGNETKILKMIKK